jgi:hypothetical protein
VNKDRKEYKVIKVNKEVRENKDHKDRREIKALGVNRLVKHIISITLLHLM